LAFGELGDFRGILKVSYNRAFSVTYSKNMRISASQNMFRPTFLVIYPNIYKYIAENLPHIRGILCNFWGILGDF
jgi:hypothetical protein